MRYAAPLTIFLIILISIPIRYAFGDTAYPLLNKALFCKDNSVNWQFRPYVIYFGDTKREIVKVSIGYDFVGKRFVDSTYRAEISFFKVTDEKIGWRYKKRGLQLDYLNSPKIDVAMYLDRTTLKLSEQRLWPLTSVKPHKEFNCKILNNLKEADLILSKSIEEAYDAIYRIIGKPPTEDELEKRRKQKLKDRKI